MWLLVYAPAILGVLRYRRWSYWRWVVAMLLWQAAAQFLQLLDHAVVKQQRPAMPLHQSSTAPSISSPRFTS